MANYNRWPKEDLIKRVQQLEAELKTRPQNNALLPESTRPQRTDGAGENTTISIPEHLPNRAKKHRSMDPSKWATRFVALKLAYIGKNYNGFEYQASGAASTIEEELWKALVRACLVFPDPARPNEVDWNVCGYSKCGRTDRGVSAFGQVIALSVRSNKPGRKKRRSRQPTENRGEEATAVGETAGQGGEDAGTTTGTVPMPEEEEQQEEEEDEDHDHDHDDTPLPPEQEIQYPHVLNRLLPPDIRVYAWCPNPPPDFSARFSCRERQYRYFFTQPAFAPLPGPPETTADKRPGDGWLDIDAMRRAAKMFEGLHDFRNFCKIDPSKQITNFERRIYEADVVEVDDGADSSVPYLSNAAGEGKRYPKVYYFHVRGSAFLWHQIRCMVAVLFLVGQGLEPASLVASLLDADANPRRPNYVMADDAPLVLWDCLFGRDAGQGAPDGVAWLHADPEAGVVGDLWACWRERKVDEILANRLLDWVAHKTDVHGAPAPAGGEGGEEKEKRTKKKRGPAGSTRLFEGGNGPKLAGTYVPVLRRALMQSPEEQNDRYAQRKGFRNAEEMRARGNWREVIRAAKDGVSNTGEGA